MKLLMVSALNWSVIFSPTCTITPSISFSGLKYMYSWRWPSMVIT